MGERYFHKLEKGADHSIFMFVWWVGQMTVGCEGFKIFLLFSCKCVI